MNFVSYDNLYILDAVDWKNEYISLFMKDAYGEEVFVVYSFVGKLYFYDACNEEDREEVMYGHDIELAIVNTLSDPNLTLHNVNEEWIIEILATEDYKRFEEGENE